MVIKLFCNIFFGPRLEYMFERSFKLSLHIPKRFNVFQVLKWFCNFFRVTCVIFAHATNNDVWQAIVAPATKSQKNCSKPPLRRLERVFSAQTTYTHAITKMHASAESVLKSAHRKLMLRKIARTGNKIYGKHLFLARKFAR